VRNVQGSPREKSTTSTRSRPTGYLLDRFKTFYAGEYGVLTFVEDHGLMQNCEAAGNGDSGLYPGAGADTGHQRNTAIYPEFRYSQEIRWCDSHHNAGGYSGTDGNAVHVHDNNFYDNALGFTTDVFTAAGHPGFPQDSDLIEKTTSTTTTSTPTSKAPMSLPRSHCPSAPALWIAGGNDDVIRNNRFYDNWLRGVMLSRCPTSWCGGPTGIKPEQLAAATRRTCPRRRHTATSSTKTRWASRRTAKCFRTETATRRKAAPTSGGTTSSATPATAGTTTSAKTAHPRA